MALFAQLAQLADQLATEPSRLKKRAAIADALLAVQTTAPNTPDAIEQNDTGLFALYLAGQPFAESDLRKLNTGGALLTRAVLTVTGATDAALTAAYRRHGDLGVAAAALWPEAFSAQALSAQAFSAQALSPTTSSGHMPLTLAAIATAFDTLATAHTTAARAATVEALLRRASPLEAKYLLKLMLGDMRIGVKQSLIEEAIALASAASSTAAESTRTPATLAKTPDPAHLAALRHAVMLQADLATVTARAFAGTLADARMALFHPLGFMLASPVESPEDAVARFAEKITPPPPEPPPPAPPHPAPPPPGSAAGLSPLTDDLREERAFALDPPAPALPPIHAFLEDKYDGMRAQLHFGSPAHPGRVALYSRTREDITASFPELVEAFGNLTLPPAGAILDGEILGWNVATGNALPFAVLGQRIGRKRVTDDLRRQVPVVFMAFDLLFADEELLVPLPLHERRARLEALYTRVGSLATSPLAAPILPAAQGHLFASTPIPPAELSSRPERNALERPVVHDSLNLATDHLPRLLLSPATLVTSAAAIDIAYAAARARANEGVMIKSAASPYLPGRRGLAWVKLKRHLDTLDVVITGAEFGHGRRAGLLSDYTFAVRTADGELLNVGKAYSGVTDAEIAELTTWLHAHTLHDHGHFRTVEPLRVLEVAFNNIMRSDRHSSGFALRFPRILKIRDDKPVDQIDTLARVEELYQSQPDKPTE